MPQDFLQQFNNISRCENGDGKHKKFEVLTGVCLRIPHIPNVTLHH